MLKMGYHMQKDRKVELAKNVKISNKPADKPKSKTNSKNVNISKKPDDTSKSKINVLNIKHSNKSADLKCNVKETNWTSKKSHDFVSKVKTPNLKPESKTATPVVQLDQKWTETSKVKYEVEKIVGEKVKNGRRFFLLKWKNYSSNVNTWEPEEHLENCKRLISDYRRICANMIAEESKGSVNSPISPKTSEEMMVLITEKRNTHLIPEKILEAKQYKPKEEGIEVKFVVTIKNSDMKGIVYNNFLTKTYPHLLLDYYETEVSISPKLSEETVLITETKNTHLIPEKILEAKQEGTMIKFVVTIKNSDMKGTVYNNFLTKMYPQVLLDYYETRASFNKL